MPSDENIVCDPVAFIPERTQLNLRALGIEVVDAEWGDSEHELFLVKQERGEIPADRHPPNRTVTIKLRVRKEVGTTLAEAVKRLQMKVGRWQDEGGWVERVPDSGGGFTTPVGFVVHTATLGGLHGWAMAHRKVAPEVVLTLTVGPYCYGTKEVESGEFKASEVTALEFELPNIQGSAPGIMRVRAKNEGTNDWLGGILAMESRDHSAAATAKLLYEAEELTLLGLAAKATRAGASGGGANNVVSTGSLSSTWAAVLYSKIAASGLHMTHTGNRRIVLRLWDPNGTAASVRFRAEWRVLGGTRWISNEEQKTQVVGNFSYVDLGETRPEAATLGEQRWEVRIAARTVGAVGETAQMDCLFMLPTEQYAIVQEYIEAVAGQVLWEDQFTQIGGGNITGASAVVGGVYEGAGSANDIKYSGTGAGGYAWRSAISDTTINNGRFLFAASTKSKYQNAKVTLSIPTPEAGNWAAIVNKVQYGLLMRYTNVSNFLRVTIVLENSSNLMGNIKIEKCVAGVVTTLAQTGAQLNLRNGGKLNATVTETGRVVVKWEGSTGGSGEISAEDAVLKTAGALQEGKVGLYDVNTSAVAVEKKYDEATASTFTGGEEPKFATCWAGRNMEFRSDGVFRQHQTDEVWSRMVPDGFLPIASPSGLEARALKGIVIPSTGNFESLPDREKIKGMVKVFYFPGYHFASEAK